MIKRNFLSCIIIDDDAFSMAINESLVLKSGLLELKAHFSSSLTALQWLNENTVDLIFLDMEMPGLSGMDLLDSLIYKPEIIMITNNPNHAVQAFDRDFTDYLVKPITDYSRFLAAVNKVYRKKNEKKGLEHIEENSVFVKVETFLLRIDLNKISLIEAFGDYIKIYTGAKMFTVYSTLKKFDNKLDSNKFARVHRSFIVNKEFVENIGNKNLQIGNRIIPISDSYKDELLKSINTL